MAEPCPHFRNTSPSTKRGNFFPTSAVSRRVYLSAPQVPPLLESLSNTFRQFTQKAMEQQAREREERERIEREQREGEQEPPGDGV